MAYDAATAEVRMILEMGMPQRPGLSGEITRGSGVFSYCSSHAGTDVGGVVGFFSGCGGQPRSSTGTPPSSAVARSTNNVGMRSGDLLVNIESSAGASPGSVTWHCAIASTLQSGGGGYDVTVST
jgi:hypothetical protein